MERSEPSLVPEWLRSTGSVSGGGSSAQHFAAHSSQPDTSSQAQNRRNRTSKSISDLDKPHSAFLDRTSSSNSRRNSSNGSGKHAYSSFNRNHRDKDREREKERFNFGDDWDRECSEPLGNIFSSRAEKETFRRSSSMISRKQGDLFLQRVAVNSKSSGNGSHSNSNGMLSGSSIGGSVQKAVFDKDFPSLGSEDKLGVPDIGRVSSPGLSTAVQSLPVGSTAFIGGEGWTSALVEVPSVVGGSGTGSSAGQQTDAANTGSGPPSTTTGLNMAEALAQAPSRARTAPRVNELSVKTQRLEELAIKQSRQLIPVTPAMPKASVLSSDKSKPKTPPRTGELNVTTKSGQQLPSLVQHANQSFRAGLVKPDTPKTSHGKFLVLKPVWENGVSPTLKDAPTPTSNVNSTNSQLAVAPSVAPTSLRSPNNLNPSFVERKVAALDLKPGATLEKKSSFSQVQSRNDFFNLIKKKTSMTSSTTLSDSDPIISSLSMEKSEEASQEIVSSPASPCTSRNGAELTSNGESCEEHPRFHSVEGKSMSLNEAVYPDEEEAAFLRSLGWEENSGEDEGLTEEEINAFYQEYMKLKPSLKLCRGTQPKLSMLSESHEATN